MASVTQSISLSKSPDRIQSRLLISAGVFLALYAIALTIAPAVQSRDWSEDLRWEHWLGYSVWLVLVSLAHLQSKKTLPNRDPYLLPIAALLCGWGLMTIWRLFPEFGLRQTVWFTLALGIFTFGLRFPNSLDFLRRYKYVWLISGLILTALTLIFGTNPSTSTGPRLWLGCCGVYFQPSEPLKLLLVIYLSAYLADRQPWIRVPTSFQSKDEPQQGSTEKDRKPTGISSLSLLAPILFMTGLTLLLLLIQRDLGTGTIFLFLFTVSLYIATERKLFLILSVLLLIISVLGGYFLFDVVRLRVDAWINPWLDPIGRSYQIVQSLLAMANGGLVGRGPGMGSPSLVPISHSDFIYSAIVEESGFLGGIALIASLMIFTTRGLRASMRAPDNFRRYLAAGLTAYLVGQSLLIIGGNIRLLPLTGVTLPFVSYGGSSLVTAYITLLILTHISQSANTDPELATNPSPYTNLGLFLLSSLLIAALIVGWWTIYRSPDLLERTDNVRRTIADRYVKRGDIFDRNNTPLVRSDGNPGDFHRNYLIPGLGSLVGYSHPVYGLSGLEADFDPYLRGLRGNADFDIWWNHLLYGQPPPGLDVRLNIDMDIQMKADELLSVHSGALVILNAENGEILTLASRPTFDPNTLDDTWGELVNDANSPLFNRATQGRYQAGSALGPFLLTALSSRGELPELPDDLNLESEFGRIECAYRTESADWVAAIANGCPHPQYVLAQELGVENLIDLLDLLALFSVPSLDAADEETSTPPESLSLDEIFSGGSRLRVSPLQMVRAAAALTSAGTVPRPLMIRAIRYPDTGWTGIPPAIETDRVFSPTVAESVINSLADEDLPIWQSVARTPNAPDEDITWYIAGTLPRWEGVPLSLIVLLETDDSNLAMEIGQRMMAAVLGGD